MNVCAWKVMRKWDYFSVDSIFIPEQFGAERIEKSICKPILPDPCCPIDIGWQRSAANTTII